MLSVIFPVYNESGNVEELHRLNKGVLESLGLPYEIIIVDDGSTDNTLSKLKQLSPIRVVALTRRFGQTTALAAGIEVARGNIIVIMDGDLQNDPQDIHKMLVKLEEGYDVVAGWRKNRHDNVVRRVHSYLANWLTRAISGLDLHDHACALKIYRKEFIKSIKFYGVQHVFLAAQVFRLGARIAEVEVIHHNRKRGLSKHHFFAGIKAIADLIMVRFLSPDTRPLVFFAFWSLVSWFLALILGLSTWLFGVSLWIISVVLLFFGFIIFMFGFIAELLRRIYLELSQSPRYIVKEIVER